MLTINSSIRESLREACQILLERAFQGQRMCAFGEDGCGKYGQHTSAHWYDVFSIDVSIAESNPNDQIEAYVSIFLLGYDSTATGHIATDKNFEINAKSLLAKNSIDPDAISWPDDISLQGDVHVTFALDIEKLFLIIF